MHQQEIPQMPQKISTTTTSFSSSSGRNGNNFRVDPQCLLHPCHDCSCCLCLIKEISTSPIVVLQNSRPVFGTVPTG